LTCFREGQDEYLVVIGRGDVRDLEVLFLPLRKTLQERDKKVSRTREDKVTAAVGPTDLLDQIDIAVQIGVVKFDINRGTVQKRKLLDSLERREVRIARIGSDQMRSGFERVDSANRRPVDQVPEVFTEPQRTIQPFV